MVTEVELVFWCIACILAVGFSVSACLFTPCDLYVSECCVRRACGERMH